MSNGNSGAQSARIPAWKRLGLKLKYAKETADQPTTSQAQHQDGGKISSSEHAGDAYRTVDGERPSKKLKISPESHQSSQTQSKAADSRQLTGGDRNGHASNVRSTGRSTFDNDGEHVTSLDTANTPLVRRKSVTFTEDTKQEDGISAKPLTAKPPKVDAFEAVTESTETDSVPSKKDKKKRKGQQHEAATTSESIGKPQYLQYLELFENDRGNWKFNKNHQSTLLTHIFDIKQIPASYNAAIADYLSGLQGNAVRDRLIDGATDILKSVAGKGGDTAEIDGMESVQARRDAYAASLRRQIERVDRHGLSEHDQRELEDEENEIERGRRAEQILTQMLQQQQSSRATPTSTNGRNSSSVSQVPVIGNSQGALSTTASNRRKRKSRTQGSSSDDSSSDSENDERVAPRPMVENTVTKATYGTARGEPKVSQPLETMATGKKIIFDDELLDTMFPKSKATSDATSQRNEKRYGGAKNGTQTDNAQESEGTSGSESDSESSESSSDSESDSE